VKEKTIDPNVRAYNGRKSPLEIYPGLNY